MTINKDHTVEHKIFLDKQLKAQLMEVSKTIGLSLSAMASQALREKYLPHTQPVSQTPTQTSIADLEQKIAQLQDDFGQRIAALEQVVASQIASPKPPTTQDLLDDLIPGSSILRQHTLTKEELAERLGGLIKPIHKGAIVGTLSRMDASKTADWTSSRDPEGQGWVPADESRSRWKPAQAKPL